MKDLGFFLSAIIINPVTSRALTAQEAESQNIA